MVAQLRAEVERKQGALTAERQRLQQTQAAIETWRVRLAVFGFNGANWVYNGMRLLIYSCFCRHESCFHLILARNSRMRFQDGERRAEVDFHQQRVKQLVAQHRIELARAREQEVRAFRRSREHFHVVG